MKYKIIKSEDLEYGRAQVSRVPAHCQKTCANTWGLTDEERKSLFMILDAFVSKKKLKDTLLSVLDNVAPKKASLGCEALMLAF